MASIRISQVEGKPALCFDTGLNPRSFAQAKFAQCFTEPGYIVYPDGTTEPWKVSGVVEEAGSMLVWGPSFSGERLDLLIENSYPRALRAVVFWIHSKLLSEKTQIYLDPRAAFVTSFSDETWAYPQGSVFFAPVTLAARCLLAEGAGPDRYTCPDLEGMEAVAFCAGAMLYRVFAGAHPYPAAEAGR
jgi:hypothetical protein